MRNVAVAAVLMACALGARPAASGSPPDEPTRPVLERADLEGYLAGFLPFALRRADMAGAIVVVVKNGQILLQKGYGLADMKAGLPVDPQTTLFRPGSITKLVTWTAVMQLVAAGRLDLDRDVNAYLDFTMPAPFGKPVTLRHLMTHTAGLEDAYKDLLTKDAASTPSVESYVKMALPPQLFAPGSTVAYSNYGATLAGYIVQRVSGEPYATYVERHIFAPLGMTHSTFAQPVPAGAGVFGPLGYRIASQPPRPFEFIGTVPAGALSTTGVDMAHFMIAHLEGGEFAGARILDESSLTVMHAPAFRPVPALQAMSLGFYGEDRNGRRIIGHAGDLISFHADLHLLLDEHVGLFVAFNSLGRNTASTALREGLFAGFMDRYFPAPSSREPPTLPSAVEHGKRLIGEYELSRRVEHSFASLGNLLGAGKLSLNEDGTISLSTLTDYNDQPKRWREIAPFQWREVNGASRLVAIVDGGHVRALASDDKPPIAVWQPVPWIRAASWNLPLLVATLLILVATLLAWPVIALVRRHYRRPAELPGRALLRYRLTRVIVLVDLVFLAGWLAFLLAGSDDLTLLTSASDPILRLLQLTAVCGLVGLPLVFAHLVDAWRDGNRSWARRVWSMAVSFACLATAWFAVGFHFLSVALRY